MLLVIAWVAAQFVVPRGQEGAMSVVFVALGLFVYGPQMLIAVAAADFATKAVASSVVGLTGLFGYLGASVCGVATGNRRAAHSFLPNFAGPVVAFT
jgi:sugar phosphate permease